MTITVHLTPYHINYDGPHPKLVVRYRVYNHGKWSRNGFWLFSTPVHEQDIFERADCQFGPAKVYMQLNFGLLSYHGTFYSLNAHKPLT